MKDSHKILLASLFVALLLSNGCKPKDCKEDGSCAEEYYRIRIGEAKSYLWALPGSYWIYKNSVTGDLDTQTCIGFSFDSVKVRGSNNYSKFITAEYDVIKRVVYSSYNKIYIYDQTPSRNPDGKDYNKGWDILDRHSNGFGTNIPFFFPFESGVQASDGASISICKGMDTSLIIQGQLYHNVGSFDIDLDGITEKDCQKVVFATTYYWAKDVGLIKKDVKSCNFSWELIDYNIIK